MGRQNDREHFEDYRAQTQVKHEILAAYLGPYFQIVGKTNANLLYIDGFAGPGSYTKADTGEVIDGSPLRALKLIAGNDGFAQKVSTLFIEWDEQLYHPLENIVNDFVNTHVNIRVPKTVCCTFTDGVKALLDEVSGKLPPTFLFVDPCGVSSTSFDTIKRVMACKSSEAFIFFNIDGVRRIAGLNELSDVLIELFGSEKRARELFDTLKQTADVKKREQMIVNHYRQAIRNDMSVKYTIPFRVESVDKQKSSHYLIHASNHHLGFKIMKDVMWTRGHSETGQGELQFIQASRTDYNPMFDPNYVIKDSILDLLTDGPQRVAMFYDDWVFRPDDLHSEPEYRRALLELEADNKIEVFAKDAPTPMPAMIRRRKNGKPTLGKDYVVKLAKSS